MLLLQSSIAGFCAASAQWVRVWLPSLRVASTMNASTSSAVHICNPPPASLGITGLACAAPEHDGPYPLNRRGIELRDGRGLPLWDWIVTPIPPSPGGKSITDRRR